MAIFHAGSAAGAVMSNRLGRVRRQAAVLTVGHYADSDSLPPRNSGSIVRRAGGRRKSALNINGHRVSAGGLEQQPDLNFT